MTDEGRLFAIARLSAAPNIEALRTVWESLGGEYRKCPKIQTLKDQLKANMETNHGER